MLVFIDIFINYINLFFNNLRDTKIYPLCPLTPPPKYN